MSNNFDWLLLAFPLVVALGFSAAAAYASWLDSQLRQLGIALAGRVLQSENDRRFGVDYCWVEVQYEDTQGVSHTFRQPVNPQHLARLRIGQTVALRMMTDNPATTRLADADHDDAQRRGYLVRGTLFLVVWVVLLIIYAL